ncbi:hypothetical protein COMNV_01001 [Commensalibacter sp. Nvir]|uniref:class I SAM-dependent methyltransferase n=1 Tax=Commensalibacter sp. Nvir TaxID=3069817 RepID=UPI002D2710A7|nr:hypothetical protein COMNV_01001 [Commensalibacter sp. Nvir]
MAVPHLFDRRIVKLHRDRAYYYYKDIQSLNKICAERLLDRFSDVNYRFSNALEMGGRGYISSFLLNKGIATISADLSQKLVSLNRSPSLSMDEEFIPFKANSFDLVIAHFNLHWVNDLPGTLMQIRNILKPNGFFLATIPIVPTLDNLRKLLAELEIEYCNQVSSRVSAFPDLRACAVLMQRAEFSLSVVDKETIHFIYQNAFSLMKDLQKAGENNALNEVKKNLSDRFFAHFLRKSNELGELSVALDFAILTGWAPDESQSHPLKPGQYNVSLSDYFEE